MDIAGLSEAAVRFIAFAGIFLAMALFEVLRPKRKLRAPKQRRWLTNISIVALDSLIVRVMAQAAVPLVAIAAALWAEARGFGLFNVLDWPAWLEIAICVVALDFALWLQHFASHKLPMLWRVHQMHHADPDIDVTTAIRFHPVEIALSMLWKIVWVLVFGVSPIAVLIFEIVLNGCAMFNHANIALPAKVDAAIRTLIVTPDMHRVHHSTIQAEHDTNYGFNLSIWDRMFSTYTAQPKKGHEGMEIGLACYRDEGPTRLGWSLRLPFRDAGGRD